MYFKLQTALCVLLALTNTPKVHGSVMEDNILPGWLPSLQSESTKQGDRQTEMLKLTGMVTLAATNMLVLVPTTHKYVGKVHMSKLKRPTALNRITFTRLFLLTGMQLPLARRRLEERPSHQSSKHCDVAS